MHSSDYQSTVSLVMSQCFAIPICGAYYQKLVGPGLVMKSNFVKIVSSVSPDFVQYQPTSMVWVCPDTSSGTVFSRYTQTALHFATFGHDTASARWFFVGSRPIRRRWRRRRQLFLNAPAARRTIEAFEPITTLSSGFSTNNLQCNITYLGLTSLHSTGLFVNPHTLP